jgi:hypothetical protein
MSFVRKKQSIDILKLYTTSNYGEWNVFLYKCLLKNDVTKLMDTRQRLQIGMDDLTKKNFNTEKISIFFIRLQRSIDKTLKEIYRREFDNPLYNPNNKSMYDEFIDDKRKKDNDLEKIILSGSY